MLQGRGGEGRGGEGRGGEGRGGEGRGGDGREGRVIGQSLESLPLPSAPSHTPLVDGDEEEVDEPGQRVLVHGVDVGEVRDGEEQHRAVGGHGTVPGPGLLDLPLRLISHL